MPVLLVLVEGQTEAEFVREVLAHHLKPLGYDRVQPRIFGNVRHRGGIRPWPAAKREIVNQLKSSPGYVTTMVDYYGMPASKQNAWPGRAEARQRNGATKRAACIEGAVKAEIDAAMGPRFNQNRIIPFVAMHEFEALLFSDCGAAARTLGEANLLQKLTAVRSKFDSPEEIDDSPMTAPSKRLLDLVRCYDKVFHGPLITLETGLAKIREECPLFDAWIRKLESLGHSGS